jgi:hypothetical protein
VGEAISGRIRVLMGRFWEGNTEAVRSEANMQWRLSKLEMLGAWNVCFRKAIDSENKHPRREAMSATAGKKIGAGIHKPIRAQIMPPLPLIARHWTTGFKISLLGLVPICFGLISPFWNHNAYSVPLHLRRK